MSEKYFDFCKQGQNVRFEGRNNLRNAFLSLTNDEHKNRKSLTLTNNLHSLFVPISYDLQGVQTNFGQEFNSLFLFLQCMSLKPEKNSSTFQNGLQTTTFFLFNFSSCELRIS